MTDTPPVFVVGAPRSGTTLVAAAIAAHPDMRSGPESHFFNNLAAADREAAVADPEWPTEAARLLESLTRDDERVIDMFGVTPDQVAAYLRTRRPSQAAMLAALFEAAAEPSATQPGATQPGTTGPGATQPGTTQPGATQPGTTGPGATQPGTTRPGATEPGAAGPGTAGRWVEKTPNHIWRLAEIVEQFPDAPIIHVVRDPRDVARSLVGLPWATTSRVANAWMWSSWVRELARARQDPRIAARITEVRFEDFLADPEATLTALCAAIGIRFDPGMLSPERTAAAMVSSGEWWKAKNATAIDPERAFAWRRDADDLDEVIATMCFDELRPRGYDTGDHPRRRMPLASFTFLDAALLEDTLVRAALAGVAIVPTADDDPGKSWLWSEREALRAGRRGTAIRIARVRLRRTRALRPTRTLKRDRTFER
ncbi:sulfotransferase [Microbacter sp. GSS18]|nr:sulfotransferase [Microbacter sp. GSS18]